MGLLALARFRKCGVSLPMFLKGRDQICGKIGFYIINDYICLPHEGASSPEALHHNPTIQRAPTNQLIA